MEPTNKPAIPEPPATVNPSPVAVDAPPAARRSGGFALRRPIPKWQSILLGVSCIAIVFCGWWIITRGEEYEMRIVGPLTLPSPYETFSAFKRLWFDQELSSNVVVTVRRVTFGFLLATFIGVPLGVLAGCFPRVHAFFMPLIMFGRNIPIAALLPLLILAVQFDLWFLSANEQRKILFIFVASVAFIMADTARAISDVAERYVDTAYTLGASRWQTITKVLVPLAAPTVFSSCRLMFGIAFGYIMLAESIKEAGGVGGLGFQIQTAQRRNDLEAIYLIIIIIPLIALMVDQFLYWMQRSLFPYQYPSDGALHYGVRGVMHLWDDAKRAMFGVPEGAKPFMPRVVSSPTPSAPSTPTQKPAAGEEPKA